MKFIAMRTQKRIQFIISISVITTICFVIGCVEDNSFEPNSSLKNALIQTTDDLVDCKCVLSAPDHISLAEKEMLIFTREEEKLARDVYISFSALYSIPVFEKIHKSEQIHMDKVLCLLIHYNIEDPASDLIGVFKDPLLQELYNTLISNGSVSLSEALKVGATIEDLDLVDLQECINQTENVAIITIFANLMCASGNHLRAFSRLLNNLDLDYSPQFLTQDEYEKVLEEDLQDCKSEF